jgi:hypothetical protein
MRAREFVTEARVKDGGHNSKKGKLHPHQKNVLGPVHKVAGTADRTYDLNRAMMALASSDGKNFSHEPDGESWVARNNVAYPYTDIEHDMLDHVYSHLDLSIQHAVEGKGVEPNDTHKISPVVGFKGYE